MLSLAYRFDEAERFLRLMDMLATRPSRFVWGLLEIGAGAAALFVATMLLGFLALLLVPSQASVLHHWLSQWFELRGGPGLALLGNALTFLVGLFVLTAPLALLLPLMRGNPWAYGWERPSLALMLDVAPIDRPTSLKVRAAEHFEIPIGAFGKGKWMAHTAIYDDARIHKKLAEWIVHGQKKSADGSIVTSEEPRFSSNSAWAAPWKPSRFAVLLGLPVLLLLGITLAHPTRHGVAWIDLEPLQYLAAAALGAWGGLTGVAVIALAAVLKCLRYAGQFELPGLPQLRVIHRGSLGEAAALLSIGFLFAQQHRLRLILRASWLPTRQALMLAALALLTVATPAVAGLSSTTWAYAWLLLIAFLLGLSQIPLAGVGAALAVIAGSSMLAAMAGLAPTGHLSTLPMPFGLRASLPLVAPMHAINLALAALLGRGLRQRMWAGAATDRPSRLGRMLTTPAGLIALTALGLGVWCFALGITYGVRSGAEVRTLLTLHPQFLYLCMLVGFTAGALHGRRAFMGLMITYLVAGLALPTLLAVLVAAPGNPIQKVSLPLDFARMPAGAALRLEGTLGHLVLGRGLELPLAALLGWIVAARAPELSRAPTLSAARVHASDAALLRADEIEPEPRQILPSLAFRVLDLFIVTCLAALALWWLLRLTFA